MPAAVVGFAIVVVPAALAQGPDSVTVDVAECVELPSPEERFACYERRVAATRSGAAATADAPQATASPAANETERGAAAAADRPDGERAAARERRAERRDEEEAPTSEPQEHFGTIATLRETVPNSHVITLEDGQVWRQMRPKWYPLQPGYRVRIYPTRWGDAYRMTAERLNGFIQVERVR